MTDQRVSADGGMETSFGFRNVDAGEKQPLVNDVFHKVAKRYDRTKRIRHAGKGARSLKAHAIGQNARCR